jgi:hypothetical protein
VSIKLTKLIRTLADQTLDDISDLFLEISYISISICEEQGYTGDLEKACSTCAKNVSQVLQAVLLWSNYDVYVKVQEMDEAMIAKALKNGDSCVRW